VQFFLWLLSKNKILTRDNLSIRKKLDDMIYLFCLEKELVQHLFFDCVVAKQMWVHLSEVCDRGRPGLYVNMLDVVKQ
jgi:hypothetical protein